MESQLTGSPLAVCTFNMGSSVGDYMQLCKRKKLNLEFKSREEEEAFRTKYAAVQKIAAERLIDRNCDCYCLQEVGEETRPLIEKLKAKNYQIIHIEDKMFDAAIAIKQDRFSSIVNLSHQITVSKIHKKDVAMASATDSKTGRNVFFVSGHVPAFTFAAPQTDEVAAGDNYCKAISQRLAQISEPILKIMGLDMNGYPEFTVDRFQTFVDDGFQICRTHSPTNLYMEDAEQPETELDFIFVKNEEKGPSGFRKITAIFQKKKETFTVAVESESLLSWDPEQNSSDHLPVCATVTLIPD